MGRLIYSALTSLDGFIEDAEGHFGWAEPDAETHTFVNDLERTVGTHLVGRRMYEVMAVWDTMDLAAEPPHIRDFAEIWRAADKIVFSRTLDSVSGSKTRLERGFDAEAVRRLKARAEADLMIGGPDLAASAFDAGLVDEVRLFLAPVIVGGGKRALPDGVRLDLEVADARRFGSGMVYLGHRVRG